MVIKAETASMPPPDPEAAASSRPGAQSQLHSISFPTLKKWGSQRVLRCLNDNRNSEPIGGGRRFGRPDAAGLRIRTPDQETAEGVRDEQGFDGVATKLLVHLHQAADRLKLVVPPEPEELPELKLKTVPVPEPPSSAAGPWNLRRRRRRSCGSSRAVIQIDRDVSLSPPAERSNNERAVRLRSEDAAGKRKRPRFSVTLTREEIEEDIYAVTGSLSHRRPRKRARIVQQQLDSLFPGSWLSEITADSYKVPD